MSREREVIAFRGLRGRTLDDQARALNDGYHSVTEMAVDEMGQLVLELLRRIENLEAAAENRRLNNDGCCVTCGQLLPDEAA